MFQHKKRERAERAGRLEDKEFEQELLDLARVTRVTAGGKRMRFRAAVVIGNRRGKVGFGLAKGADTSLAINKAVRKAKKNLLIIPLFNETIPHQVKAKFGAAEILLKPAPRGAGIIAGGAMRTILDLGGVPNVVGKMLGSKNKINNAKATFLGLSELKSRLV